MLHSGRFSLANSRFSTFGRRLKAIRTSKGIDQRTVGASAGIDDTTVHRYEEEKTTPNLDRLRALARGLEVSVAYLTGDDVSLEKLTVDEVVARESLRFFLDTRHFTEDERRGLIETSRDVAAPRTVSGWRDFYRMLLAFSEGEPDQQEPGSPSDLSFAALGRSSSEFKGPRAKSAKVSHRDGARLKKT
jgi:transcriptional regulator with XRE-family HTH domain